MRHTVRSGLTPIRLALVIIGLLLSQAHLLVAADVSLKGKTRSLIKSAHAEIAVGKPEAALISLQSVLEIDPGNPAAHYLMGQVELSRNAIPEADEILTRGMALAPLSRRIKLLLAKVKLAQDEPDAAEGLISEVLTLAPHDTEANFLLGSVALARADTTAALDLWQAALTHELEAGVQ